MKTPAAKASPDPPYSPEYIETCDFCAGDRFIFVRQKDHYHIIACAGCGLVTLDYPSKEDALRRLYSEAYFRNVDGQWITRGYPDYFAMEPVIRKSASKRLKGILSMVKGGRLLDIGCGPGFFLDVARRDFEVLGIDLSAFAANYAKEHLGLRVFDRSLFECRFREEEFDVVTLWDTIEHLHNPKDTLREVHRILKKGGLMVVQTGDVSSLFARVMRDRWHLYNVPEHLFFFSRNILERMVATCGFTVHRVRYEWSYYSMAFLLDRAIRMLFPSKTFPYQDSFLGRLFLPANLFDIMTLYAQKQTE